MTFIKNEFGWFKAQMKGVERGKGFRAKKTVWKLQATNETIFKKVLKKSSPLKIKPDNYIRSLVY